MEGKNSRNGLSRLTPFFFFKKKKKPLLRSELSSILTARPKSVLKAVFTISGFDFLFFFLTPLFFFLFQGFVYKRTGKFKFPTITALATCNIPPFFFPGFSEAFDAQLFFTHLHHSIRARTAQATSKVQVIHHECFARVCVCVCVCVCLFVCLVVWLFGCLFVCLL